jgi:hypothetical protein
MGKRDLLKLKCINTSDNYSDVMKKATGRTIFYRHMNYILGKIPPACVDKKISIMTLYTHML